MDPNTGAPHPYLNQETARRELDQIRDDLARYESMPAFKGPIEGAAALAGTLAGAAVSPESWITRFPGAAAAASWLGKFAGESAAAMASRIFETGISQGAVQVVTDPLAQAGSLSTGIQHDYDLRRTALAFPLGAIFGGLVGAGHEAASALLRGRTPMVSRETIQPPEPPTEPPRVAPASDTVPSGTVPPAPAEAPSARPAAEGAVATASEPGPPRPIDDPLVNAWRDVPVEDRDLLAGALEEILNRRGSLRPADIPKHLRDEIRLVAGETINRAFTSDPADAIAALRSISEEAKRAADVSRVTPGEEARPAGIPAFIPESRKGELRSRGYTEAQIREMKPEEAVRILRERAALGAEDPSTRVVPNTPAADVERDRLQNVAQQEAIAAAAPAAEEIRGRAAPEVAGAPARVQPTLPPAAPAGAPEPSQTLQSLHQQAFDLADMVDTPLRQGRLAARDFMGQYDPSQDVFRSRAVADFDAVAHEVGHALERHTGPDLTALTQRFAGELGPLDYDPNLARVHEGFAEWFQHYLTAPAAAQREAPGFYNAFREFMAREQPELSTAIDRAQATYQAWLNASPTVRLETIVQRKEDDTIARELRREGLANTVSLRIRNFYQHYFDDNAPFARAVRAIAAEAFRASGTRMDIPAHANPELLRRINSRAVQTAQEQLTLGVVPYHGSGFGPEGPGLRQVLTTAHGMRTTGERLFGRWNDRVMTDLDSYLAARQLEMKWRLYDAGELTNIPGPVLKSEVAQAITELEAAHPTFRQAADEWTAMTRQMLRKAYEAGILGRETYQTLVQREFYAPLHRVLDDQPVRAAGMGGARGTPRGVELFQQRFGGSMRDIISPIQSIEGHMVLLERAIAENDVSKALASLGREARKMGATGVGRVIEEIPPHEIVGQRFELREAIRNAAKQNGVDPHDTELLLSSVIDIFGKDPIMGTLFRSAPAKARGEPIKFYMDGGELRALRIGDPELYSLMTELPPALRDAALNWLAISSTAIRAGIVHNPPWMLFNFVRDQVAASILHPGYVPFNPKGIVRTIRDDGWVHLYGMSGGMNPAASRLEADRTISREIDALARKGWSVQVLGSLRDMLPYSGRAHKWQSFGRFMSELAGVSEIGTRLNIFERVFKQKKTQGLSDYEAAAEAGFQAKDLIDFGRHGSRTQELRSLIPFLNAWGQAVDKARRHFFVPLYRAATGGMSTQQDVEALQRAGLSWMMLGGVGSAAGYAYGLLMGNQEIYQDADPTMRATHLIVPGKAFGLEHDILLAPKPFELAVGFNLGEAAGIAMATGDPRAAHNAMTGVLDVLAPSALLPPGVKTGVELLLNRSFFTGREIVRPEEEGRPAAQQFRPGTSHIAKALGELLGWSPLKIDYFFGSAFGSLGRDAIHAADVTDPNAPDIPPENTMFLRRGIKQADITSQTTQTFWRLAGQQNGEYVGAKNAYDQAITDHRDKDAADFLAKLPNSKRAYVTLQSAVDENGKPFKADEKGLHPLTRAFKAVSEINGMISEISGNAQKQLDGGQALTLNSRERREAIDGLRQIQAMEQRNALVILGERGYESRKLLSVEDEFGVLQAKLPAIADELGARYATARISKTAEEAKAWPQAQRRLLREGGAADLTDLAADVRSEGPAFEGERVRHPQRRRRVEIPPLPAAVAVELAR